MAAWPSWSGRASLPFMEGGQWHRNAPYSFYFIQAPTEGGVLKFSSHSFTLSARQTFRIDGGLSRGRSFQHIASSELLPAVLVELLVTFVRCFTPVESSVTRGRTGRETAAAQHAIVSSQPATGSDVTCLYLNEGLERGKRWPLASQAG